MSLYVDSWLEGQNGVSPARPEDLIPPPAELKLPFSDKKPRVSTEIARAVRRDSAAESVGPPVPATPMGNGYHRRHTAQSIVQTPRGDAAPGPAIGTDHTQELHDVIDTQPRSTRPARQLDMPSVPRPDPATTLVASGRADAIQPVIPTLDAAPVRKASARRNKYRTAKHLDTKAVVSQPATGQGSALPAQRVAAKPQTTEHHRQRKRRKKKHKPDPGTATAPQVVSQRSLASLDPTLARRVADPLTALATASPAGNVNHGDTHKTTAPMTAPRQPAVHHDAPSQLSSARSGKGSRHDHHSSQQAPHSTSRSSSRGGGGGGQTASTAGGGLPEGPVSSLLADLRTRVHDQLEAAFLEAQRKSEMELSALRSDIQLKNGEVTDLRAKLSESERNSRAMMSVLSSQSALNTSRDKEIEDIQAKHKQSLYEKMKDLETLELQLKARDEDVFRAENNLSDARLLLKKSQDEARKLNLTLNYSKTEWKNELAAARAESARLRRQIDTMGDATPEGAHGGQPAVFDLASLSDAEIRSMPRATLTQAIERFARALAEPPTTSSVGDRKSGYDRGSGRERGGTGRHVSDSAEVPNLHRAQGPGSGPS